MFDEPTSALDSQSKRAFVEILKERKRRHITVIATHDPVTGGGHHGWCPPPGIGGFSLSGSRASASA